MEDSDLAAKGQSMMVCIGQFSRSCYKMPDSWDLMHEKFNFVQGFGGFSPWVTDSRSGTSWHGGAMLLSPW